MLHIIYLGEKGESLPLGGTSLPPTPSPRGSAPKTRVNMYIKNMDNSTAYLSNNGAYISFSFNGRTIRFKGPYSLIRFEKIKEWDNGYLVVDAIYKHSPKEPIEDYIDLAPILEDLYIDSKAFLQPIKKVEVKNVRVTA